MEKDFSDIAARLRQHATDKAVTEETPRDFDELYRLRGRILGVLIRDARQAANLTPAQCADQIGVPPAMLGDWEFGRQTPSLPQLELLAYALSVPISHFWGTDTLFQTQEQKPIRAEDYIQVRGRLVGALLRAAREQANLTPDQLASEAGVSATDVTAYELGQRPIPTAILTTLAQVCQVNMSYFLENGNRVGEFLALQEDLKAFADLPENMRRFVATPVNQPYIHLAIRLSQMSSGQLRGIAEAILDITL